MRLCVYNSSSQVCLLVISFLIQHLIYSHWYSGWHGQPGLQRGLVWPDAGWCCTTDWGRHCLTRLPPSLAPRVWLLHDTPMYHSPGGGKFQQKANILSSFSAIVRGKPVQLAQQGRKRIKVSEGQKAETGGKYNHLCSCNLEISNEKGRSLTQVSSFKLNFQVHTHKHTHDTTQCGPTYTCTHEVTYRISAPTGISERW